LEGIVLDDIKCCTDCGRKFDIFRWRNECTDCGRIVCRDCFLKLPQFPLLIQDPGSGKKFCKKCWYASKQKICDQYEKALVDYGKVTLFPETYRGKLPIVRGSEQGTIKTAYYRDRGEAEMILKVNAAFFDCDIVYNIQWLKETDSEDSYNGKGTHYFTTWSIIGVPAKKR
jgi:hypothetical protein